LIIAAKLNKRSLVNYLLENGAKVDYRNKLALNALDYSIIHGNYEIAFNLITKMLKKELKPIEEYIKLNKEMNVPRFNMNKFYQSLIDNVDPSKTQGFNNSANNSIEEEKLPQADAKTNNYTSTIAVFKIGHKIDENKDNIIPELTHSELDDNTKMNAVRESRIHLSIRDAI
jgi:hypothetical protein